MNTHRFNKPFSTTNYINLTCMRISIKMFLFLLLFLVVQRVAHRCVCVCLGGGGWVVSVILQSTDCIFVCSRFVCNRTHQHLHYRATHYYRRHQPPHKVSAKHHNDVVCLYIVGWPFGCVACNMPAIEQPDANV